MLKKFLPFFFIFIEFQANGAVIVDHTFNVTANDGIEYFNDNKDWRIWDSFTLTADSTLDSVDYYTKGSINGSVNLSIGSTFGLSDILNYSFTPVNPINSGSFLVTADFADFGLIAGDYWLSFSGDNMKGSDRVYGGESLMQECLSANCGTAGTFFERKTVATLFKIHGVEGVATVPGPSIIALMLTGLFGLGISRRRKKSNTLNKEI